MAIGVGDYNTFLVRTLDWESEMLKPPRRPSGAIGPLSNERRELDEVPRPAWQLSEVYDLSDLELSEETLAQLDALYEKEGQRPKLSQMVDLSAVGLLSATQARFDSLYEKKRSPKLSHMLYLSAFGLSQTAQAELDSFFERNGRSYTTISSSEEEVARVDTTDGALMFFMPINEQMESFKRTPKLSEKVNLSAIDLSEATKPNLIRCTSIGNRSGCPRRSIYPAWVYPRRSVPNSTRYMPIPDPDYLEFFEKIQSSQGKTGRKSALLVFGQRADRWV